MIVSYYVKHKVSKNFYEKKISPLKSRGEATRKKSASEIEITNEGGKFELTYCCTTDRYTLNGKDAGNWTTFAHNSKDFFRKEEKDWKMVYLARNEHDTESRNLIWKFKNTSKLQISKVVVTVNSAAFESGKVLWTLCAGEFCTRLIAGQANEIELGPGL